MIRAPLCAVLAAPLPAFARMAKDDIETFRRIVNAAGIKPE